MSILAGYKAFKPTLAQIRSYTEGQARLGFESVTFIPGPKRRRLEQRTFWTETALWEFMDSQEFLKYDTVKVLLPGYKNTKMVEVEFYHEKAMLVTDGMVVFSYTPRCID